MKDQAREKEDKALYQGKGPCPLLIHGHVGIAFRCLFHETWEPRVQNAPVTDPQFPHSEGEVGWKEGRRRKVHRDDMRPYPDGPLRLEDLKGHNKVMISECRWI